METEPKAIVSFLLEDKDQQFTSILSTFHKQIELYGDAGMPSAESEDIRLTVEWHVEFDYRHYGIKDVNVIIDRVKGSIQIVTEAGEDIEHLISWPEDTQPDRPADDADAKEMAEYLGRPKWTVDLRFRARLEQKYSPGIVPHSAEVFWDKKLVVIYF